MESKAGVQTALAETGVAWTTTAVMLGLIFGGCCSNVYALEAIINFEPASGYLLTFVQFLFVAVTGYVAQFERTRPPFFLAPNQVPLSRWVLNIALFFAINMLNNRAFNYKISVPVHIILRSGGSITTMTAGYLYGKRYSPTQVIAVILITLGIILAAYSDAQNKDGHDESGTAFNTGLVVLLVAQILSAIMGLYTEATYERYGRHWRENLFYSHVLSLPLFMPFAPAMWHNVKQLAASEPLGYGFGPLSQFPSQIVFLAANVLTQYACIRGVNILAAVSSALTVTIVLSVRKLVSLLLSIWLFGNSLAPGTMAGAIIVFGAGSLYSIGSTKKKPKSAKTE